MICRSERAEDCSIPRRYLQLWSATNPSSLNRIPCTVMIPYRVITSREYWPLIGQQWSRYLDTGLWLAVSDHVTWMSVVPDVLFKLTAPSQLQRMSREILSLLHVWALTGLVMHRWMLYNLEAGVKSVYHVYHVYGAARWASLPRRPIIHAHAAAFQEILTGWDSSSYFHCTLSHKSVWLVESHNMTRILASDWLK